MNKKYLYRSIYTKLNSRPLRVASIKILDLLRIRIYRMGIDTNNICNLKCIMCYLSFYKAKEVHILPIDLFELIAKQTFKKVGILDLSCGFEPFMTKHFLDYARIARKYCNGQIGICTNALLMDEEKIQTIISERLLDEINISCDGLTEPTYNSIRRNGSFYKILSVLKILKNEKQNKKTSEPVIRLNYTMLRRNIEELENAYDFVKEYGINILQLRHAKLTKEFSGLFNESLFYHQDLSDAILSKIRCQFERDKSLTLISPALFSEKSNFISDKSNCAYPWFNFIISSNGDLRICNIGVVGNFTRQSFSEIIQSSFARNIYSRLLKGDYKDLCQNCYTISDMGSVKEKSTFIRDDIIPDRVQTGELG